MKMTFNSKDFSMHLSHELMKTYGEPYQSSITTVGRWAKKDLLVWVDYERESEQVHIRGVVATGGLTLHPNDAIAFLRQIDEISAGNTFRFYRLGRNLNIHPIIDFSIPLSGTAEDERIPKIIADVEETFHLLQRIESARARGAGQAEKGARMLIKTVNTLTYYGGYNSGF